MIEAFAEYLAAIKDPLHRGRVEEVLEWVRASFPTLEPKIAWNQPMFTEHGTFIVGFSVSSKHLAVAPERAGMVRFAEEIARSGYDAGKELVRIPWDSLVDYALLEAMIRFNIEDKADCRTFWRSKE